MNVVRSFVNYAIIRELCDRMRFEGISVSGDAQNVCAITIVGTVLKLSVWTR